MINEAKLKYILEELFNMPYDKEEDENELFSFGDVILALQELFAESEYCTKFKAYRKNWNDCWICLGEEMTFKNGVKVVIPYLRFESSKYCDTKKYVPSQEDMFAADWIIKPVDSEDFNDKENTDGL